MNLGKLFSFTKKKELKILNLKILNLKILNQKILNQKKKIIIYQIKNVINYL